MQTPSLTTNTPHLEAILDRNLPVFKDLLSSFEENRERYIAHLTTLWHGQMNESILKILYNQKDRFLEYMRAEGYGDAAELVKREYFDKIHAAFSTEASMGASLAKYPIGAAKQAYDFCRDIVIAMQGAYERALTE
jgi:hypothetical protein